MSDYDMSIHTNPDAMAWAKFYTQSRDEFYRNNPSGQFDSEENMLGWFANAMMAMHDHLHGNPIQNGDHAQYLIDNGLLS